MTAINVTLHRVWCCFRKVCGHEREKLLKIFLAVVLKPGGLIHFLLFYASLGFRRKFVHHFQILGEKAIHVHLILFMDNSDCSALCIKTWTHEPVSRGLPDTLWWRTFNYQHVSGAMGLISEWVVTLHRFHFFAIHPSVYQKRKLLKLLFRIILFPKIHLKELSGKHINQI